jgi:serine/threonine protein kinase/beta-lactam-binding protein with PASTA domain
MIGRLIDGRYQVRSRIARGGMATVYLATDLRLERRVALKIMHGHLADEGNFKERFVQEARSAARLAHPNVVNVFDQGQDVDMAYLVMEYLPGMTLRDLLKDYGILTTEQTLDIMDAVLGGLAAAHKAGIVHRDLKPENVLLADDGRIKIGDFGLSRATSANTATGQALLGTVAYLSPELLTRGVADARSDIYAAGIMMYEMMAGEQPYTGEQPMQIAFQHANETVPRPSLKNPAVPTEIDDLVLWATAREPDDRPDDASVLLARLREVENRLNAVQLNSTGVQKTIVMPAAIAPAFSGSSTTAQTQILQPSALASSVRGAPQPKPGPGADESVSPAHKLASASVKRRRRGFWWAGIIVLLAALAGGAGWYFGAGPGSLVSIPSITGQAPAAARSSLEALGFVVSEQQASSLAVAAGLAVGTDPAEGDSLLKGSPIVLLVSSGPAMLPLPELIGLQQSAADAALIGAKFTVAAPQQLFNGAANGTVLDALNPGGSSLAVSGLTAGVSYPEQQSVTLVVSAGPIPSVEGMSVEEATAALVAVGLKAAAGEQVFNESVPAGNVIQGIRNGDTVRPGDTITLQISRGPEPVVIPDVVGKTWAEAKPILQALKLDLRYNAAYDIPGVPSIAKVSAISPDTGTSVPPGTRVNISLVL